MKILQSAWKILHSFSLGIVLLLILIYLTLVGTFYQREHGLYDAQKKYFDSVFYQEEILGLNIWLPGVYLVLGILFFNMLAGGIIRLVTKPRTIGVVISHFSILGLIVAGAVSYHTKTEGHMALYPGQTSNRVQGYHNWQLEIATEGGSDVLVIPEEQFADALGPQTRTFRQSGLPFTVKISHYARNSDVVEEGRPGIPANAIRHEHFAILPLPSSPNNEANLASIFVEVIDANTGETLGKSILPGTQQVPYAPTKPPFVVKVGEKKYSMALYRPRWEIPYKVRVDDFKAEFYEATQKAKTYASAVTRFSEGGEHKEVIGMNAPMRHDGFILFQASYGQGPQDKGTDRYYTVFAVVSNPSDQWPTICCIFAGLGLLLHFVLKLTKFVNRVGKQSAETAPLPSASV